MPKLFVVSDVHGFYDEMKAALDEAGFDENNPEHFLVGCGDYFDRGPDPIKVMKYLHNLPRKILIRGNHEKLLEDCCIRGEAWSHDIHNGTADTIWNIGCSLYHDFAEMCDHALRRTKAFRDSMVNYFETRQYIFVHSWVPTISKDGHPAHYTRNRVFEYNPDWRNATQEEWDAAMWGNPFDMIDKGLNQTGKTVVFGHWSTAHKWAEIEGREEFDDNTRFEPYYGDGFIGLDCTTALSHKVGVVVLEDEFLDG